MPSSHRHSNAISNYPRVMMVVPNYPYPIVGGLERQAHELSKVLLEKGIDVQVISSKFNPDDAKFEIVEDIPVYRIPLSKVKWFRFLQSPIYLLWTLCIRRNTFDVVHLHQFGWFGLFGIVSAKLLNKPTITKLPNVGERGIPGLQRSKVGRIMLCILRSSDAIIAMSRESVSELEAVDFPMSRVLLTPNGIRSNLNLNIDTSVQFLHKPRIVFVGRLMQQKGLEDLLYAWHMLMQKTVGAKLEIWGEGPMREYLESLSIKLGISDSVQFFGHVDNVINKLPNMDIFVLPSYIEGNSNAILEAMLAGLPVVATKVGGTAMQVGEAGAEFLFEPKDRVSLFLILEKLINSPALRESLGIKMKARVKEYFDIQHVADTYISAYKSLHFRLRDKVMDSSNLVIMEG